MVVLVDSERPADTAEYVGSADALGRVVLAAVIGRDTSDIAAQEGAERRATAALTAARTAVRDIAAIDPSGVILEGRPDRAIRAYAEQHGFDRIIGVDRSRSRRGRDAG